MAAEPNPQVVPRSENFRFTHATGARPLDGFTIKRGIGVGGFGEVYYAVSDAGKEVALKRIQRHLDVELRGVRQCLNLKHLNLLSLYDIRYDDRGEAWVVMEYMLGESLREVLERHPDGLPAAEVRRWFTGVAAGTAYLHDHGIVHRDLKPGNIFDDQGIVKLGDYGLSKFISCSRRSGQTESVGTFHYMAPEIGRGSYGKEIDVYALGIVLYELLTGQVPFDGESSQEIIMKHLTADPDLSKVPAAFREPIRRALLKDPERRYRGVGEMLAALRWSTGADGANGATAPATGGPSEPLEIGEETPGIVFGPVREVVDAQVVRAGESPAGRGRPYGASPDGAQRATRTNGNVWDREPVAATLRQGVRNGIAWWNDESLARPWKIVILTIAGIVTLANLHWLVALAAVFSVGYLVYFGIWMLTGGQDAATSAFPAHRVATPASRPAPVAARSPFRPQAKAKAPKEIETLRARLAERSPVDRTADVCGSYLLSFFAAAVLTFVALMIGGEPMTGELGMWTRYAWMLGGATAMSWGVLTLGKSWETRTGDTTHRRFVMFVVGLALGLLAFAAHEYLAVPLRSPPAAEPLFAALYEGSRPLLAAWLIHFGVLFAGLRWWRQADPLRATRLSLWSVALTGLAAFLVQQVVPLHQPWVMLTAIVASMSIQLAAPWVNAQQRAHWRSEPTGQAA